MRDRIKEFRRVPSSELRANPANWRTHPPEQRAALEGILAEIGFADAVIARETPDGLELIDGHLRAETLPGELIPTLILDVDAAEANKLLLTIDPLAAMAGYDGDALSKLLESVDTGDDALRGLLDDLGKDIDLSGDDDGDLEDVEPQADKAEELQKEWKTEFGQRWVISGNRNHVLLCGDSTQEADVRRLDAKPFIMVTDPPYGVEYNPQWRNDAAERGVLSNAFRRVGKVENDERVDWSEAYRLFHGVVAYVWHDGRFTAELVANLNDSGFEIRSQVIWRKPTFAISRGHYHWQHEPCWYAVRKGGASSKWCGDRSQSTVWDISNRLVDDEGKTGHGTQKPIECMARPIRNHGGDADDVYDPFLGSGTTMLASERLGRRCFGIEISPKYCAVCLQRMKDAGCDCKLDDKT